MLHDMDGTIIDVSKLERVSEIKFNRKIGKYELRYSVNGFTWEKIDYNTTPLKKLREDLLHSWYLWKLGEPKL